MSTAYPAVRPEDVREQSIMPNFDESRPDAVTELVRILRDQLNAKDERIRFLERQLVEANARVGDQQRLLARLLERATGSAEPVAISADVADALFRSGTAVVAAGSSTPVLARRVKNRTPGADPDGMSKTKLADPPPSRPAPTDEPPALIKLSDLGLGQVQIQQIASAVLSAAPRQEDDESARYVDPLGTTVGDLPPSPPQRSPVANVVAIAPRVEQAIGEFEPTWRFERDELRRGHKALAAEKRRAIWPFRR